ncbi:MAG: hypothetical protein ABJA82_09730 [Myxococcales bacterium]
MSALTRDDKEQCRQTLRTHGCTRAIFVAMRHSFAQLKQAGRRRPTGDQKLIDDMAELVDEVLSEVALPPQWGAE